MLSQSTGTIGSAWGHMRDCFMKMRRSSTIGSVFTGFALLTTMTKAGAGCVDDISIHSNTTSPARSSRRVTSTRQKKNTAAVANPLNGLLSSSPSE